MGLGIKARKPLEDIDVMMTTVHGETNLSHHINHLKREPHKINISTILDMNLLPKVYRYLNYKILALT